MSSQNNSSKPDLDENINVTRAHERVEKESSAAAREKHLSQVGRESFPLWVITLCGLVLLIAGGVLNQAGALFSYDKSFREDYVRATPPGLENTGPVAKTALVAFSAKGAKLYSAKCSGCHGPDARGDGANYPSLVGSNFVIKDTQQLAMVIINGIQGPTSNGKTYGAGIMPAQGAGMSAEDLAGLMTYLRNSAGNTVGDIVTVEMAKKAFEVSSSRPEPGTSVTSDELRSAHALMLSGETFAPDVMVNPATLAPLP